MTTDNANEAAQPAPEWPTAYWPDRPRVHRTLRLLTTKDQAEALAALAPQAPRSAIAQAIKATQVLIEDEKAFAVMLDQEIQDHPPEDEPTVVSETFSAPLALVTDTKQKGANQALIEEAQARIERPMRERQKSIATTPGPTRWEPAPMPPRKGHWYATAWLIGASWTQLSRWHGVTRSAVLDSANRFMPGKHTLQRINAAGKNHPGITYAALEAYASAYDANLATLAAMAPLNAAKWLVTNTPLGEIDAEGAQLDPRRQ